MKKVSNFFMKHKIATIIFAVVLVAAVSLTAVTIALWNTSEDEEIIYAIPENPAEKYLEYYVMTPNTASPSGYDYYPASRVPSQLVDRVSGLAVARYDGFMKEVEIPSTATVEINGEEMELDVLHVLKNYSSNVSNGMVGNVTSVILPPSITYVEDGALTGINVYVKGTVTYSYEKINVNDEVIIVYSDENVVDTLVKKNGYYYSTVSIDSYVIVDGQINYVSKYPNIKFNNSSLTLLTTNYPEKIYIEDNNGTITYENQALRENVMTYTLSGTDLFYNSKGYMFSNGYNNYYQYVVVGATGVTLTLDNVAEKSISLNPSSKYKVSYNGTDLVAETVNYSVDGNNLLLDTNFTDYERYVSNGIVSLSENAVVTRNINLVITDVLQLANDSNNYEVTYTPDVVYLDVETVTNYSLNDVYYLLPVTDTPDEYTVTVTKEDGKVKLFTATSLEDGSILGNTTEYYLAFKLPAADCTYYADFGSGLVELTNINGLYLASTSENSTVKIYGYKNEVRVYESFTFDYQYGYLYDLSQTEGFEEENYILEINDYQSNTNEFELQFDSRLGVNNVDVVITASYYDTFNDNKLVEDATVTISKSVTDNKVLISKTDFPDTTVGSILMNAATMTNEYVFASYEIEVNGTVIYTYINDSYSMLDFYHKSYCISYLEKSLISGSVAFDYSNLAVDNSVISVSDNTLTVTESAFNYTSGAIKMDRNYDNTTIVEYYAMVGNVGWYAVSSTNTSTNIISSSYIYVDEAGLIYYSEEGYNELSYKVYSLDGTYICDMVYKNGSAYAKLAIHDCPYGYYVLDANGVEVARYIDDSGYNVSLFDCQILDDAGNSIPMLATKNGYVANNIYLASGTYYVGTASFDIDPGNEGYYDVTYNNTVANAKLSNSLDSEYKVKVGDVTYQLHPTNNPSIMVAYIYDAENNSQVFLYDSQDYIVTSYTLATGGNYKLYVNVSNNAVASNRGWVNNFFNFEPLKGIATFKLVESANSKELKIISNSGLLGDETTYSSTTKFEENVYQEVSSVFHHLGGSMYVATINGCGTYTITGSTVKFTLPVSGTYMVYYNGEAVEVVRVEGEKEYYISFDAITYHKMTLNISNNNYQEYLLANYSLSTNITKIYVKDELGNMVVDQKTGYDYLTVDLEAGLYPQIYFALDNQRRKENNYQVFANIKANIDENSKHIILNNGTSSIDYYVSSTETNLPKYSSVFTLADYQSFIGWYTDANYSTLYDGRGLVEDATYYAYLLEGEKYVYSTKSPLYTITDTSDNSIDRIAYIENSTISFKVKTESVITEVNVGGFVVEADANGIYTVNTNNITLPATINVILENQVVVATLNTKDGSLVEEVNYEIGTYETFPLPRAEDNFMYYYDKQTGIVYTDAKGRLISPYMITEDITLTAAYSNAYYVTVNKVLEDGSVETISSNSYTSGTNVESTFPRYDGMHYSDIDSMITTNGYPVKYEINQYLHKYSFTMPSSNVIINIKYVANEVASVTPSDTTKDIYVLVPTVMDDNVRIYDASKEIYMGMVRIPDGQQIYQNYIAYSYPLNQAISEFKVMAAGYESYVYRLDDNHDVYIIENLSLENEVCYLSNWVKYNKVANTYTFEKAFDSIHIIHGNVSVEGNKVTITEAITVATHDNYQYASFEVIYVEDDVKMSYLVHYTAYGTEENPVIIGDGESFKEFIGNTKFRYNSGVVFVQTADIVVEDSDGYEVVYNQGKPFNHIYDGNGYTIKYIQNEIKNNVNNGLFGYIGYYGTVKNIELDYELIDQNSTFGYETKYYLGSICSINLGTIDNVNTKEYELSCNNVRYVGGIVAHNVGTITNCTNNITIKLYNYGAAESRILGGIAGYNGGYSSGENFVGAKITNCVNNGVILLEGETGREQYVSGICGLNKGVITNSRSASTSVSKFDPSGTYKLVVNGTIEYPMYKNPEDENEYMVLAITLVSGDTVQIVNKSSGTAFTIYKASDSLFEVNNNAVSITSDGTYDLYYKTSLHVNANNVYVGNSSKAYQQVAQDQVKVALVDDWFFIDEVKNTSHGAYYFESAMLVEYYSSSSASEPFATMVYNDAQTYNYNGMETVIVDVLSGASHIEVSRLMLISSRTTGGEMWYYAYDGVKFTKIDQAFTSNPDKTYSTGKIATSSISSGVLYLYATTSGQRYATETSDICKVKYVTGEVETVSYADVTYSTDVRLGAYRVQYLDENDNVIALRSYVDGEQVAFLDGVSCMIFESIEEGSGVRRICTITPSSGIVTIELTPLIVTTNKGNPSNYKLIVNDTSNDLYQNKDNENEVIAHSYNLSAGDMIKITDISGNVENITLHADTSSSIKVEAGIVTVMENGLYDIHYNYLTKELYVAEAIMYELVLFNGSTETQKYKMYSNPNPFNQNEIMAIGVEISSGITAKIRYVGGVNYLTDINLNSTVATISNGLITFNTANDYDFYLFVNDNGINLNIVEVGDNYECNYPDVTSKTTVAVVDNEYPKVHFNNLVSGYVARVYYLDDSGDLIADANGSYYVYDVDGSSDDIPVIPNAKKLKVVHYISATNIEINEVMVNAIYPGKTLTLSTPYYGYYDMSYSSSIEDQEGLYLENTLSASTAYLNYVLNDGRYGRIKMELNEGKFYVPFDSVIGLNPSKISFTCDLTTTDYIDLQYVNGDTLYEIRLNEASIVGPYSTFTRVDLYVDEALAEWDGYYILTNDVYYEMNKSRTVTIGSSDYVMYVAYVQGDSYQIASNPSYSSVFTTSVFTDTEVMMTYQEDGFSFVTTEQTGTETYSYEITSKTFTAAGLYTLGTLKWTIAGNSTYYGSNNAEKGQQLGKSEDPFTSLTLTSENVSNVTSITVNTSGANGIDATLIVTVGGTQIGEEIPLTNTATEYEFVSETPLSGEIVLSYTQTSSVAIYFKSVSVTYTENQVNVINEYTYDYYLQSDTPGLLSTIGLVENNNVYFGFYDLGEEVTYYVVNELGSTNPLSDMITTAAGKHVIIYYETVNEYFSYVFESKDGVQYGDSVLNDITWNIDGASADYISYDGTKGVQFGKQDAGCDTLVLVSELFSDVNKVVVSTSGAAGINATLTVYVGETQIGEVITLTAENTEYVFTSNTPLNGRVRLVYEQSSSVAIYVKAISINPDLGSNAKEHDYYYEFTATTFKANETLELESLSWTLDGENGNYWSYNGTKGQQFGKADSPYTSMTLTSGSVSNVNKVVVNASGASGTNAVMVVSVDGVGLGSVSLTSDATSYAFISDTPLTGAIKLSFTQSTSTAIYIKSICVNPKVNAADVYRNELAFTVNAFYNGYKDRTVYAMGEKVKSPASPSQSPSTKYSFEFVGWKFNGKTYLVEEDTDYLYYLDNEDNKVYLYCVSEMTITPVYQQKIKQFTITLVNSDGTLDVLETKYDYGQKVSSSTFATPEVPEEFKDLATTDYQFVGWYVDSERKVIANNYPIIANTDLYAKWYVKGVFLVGTIEGYEAWNDQRDGYKFIDNGDGNDAPQDHFVLENIYLEAGDVVKPKEFKLGVEDDYWFNDWTGLPSGDVCQVSNTNLQINTSGYYSFYIHQWKATNEHPAPAGIQEIHVTYQKYMVEYSFDKEDLASQTYDYPNYRFNLSWVDSEGTSYTYFPLISEEDKRMDSTLTVTTPSLIRYTEINDVTYTQVVKGWYTRPVNGERINELSPDMLTYRNSITLYPVFINKGHYLVVDGEETFIGDSQASEGLNSLPKFNAGDTVTIYYYNGSTYTTNGVSSLDPSMVVTTNSDITFTGNTITITQDGYYDIYQDENCKLHIDQYHEVIYNFSLRYTGVDIPLVPTLDTKNIKSGVIYLQMYGSNLATVAEPVVINNSGVKVTFVGWTLQGENNFPNESNQKVTGNQTFDIVYRINDFN